MVGGDTAPPDNCYKSKVGGDIAPPGNIVINAWYVATLHQLIERKWRRCTLTYEEIFKILYPY